MIKEMSKSKESKNTETTKEVDVGGDSTRSLPVLEVAHPGPDASEEFLKEQDKALLNYKVTGQRGIYIDPTRDQEPDIAPELGLSPHPEHANPRAPEMDFGGGVNLSAKSNPVLLSAEEKTERGEKIQEEIDESLKAAEEEAKDRDDSASVAPGPSVGRTDSAMVAEGDPRAAEPNRKDEGTDASTSTKQPRSK